jgi:hypothetical protein
MFLLLDQPFSQEPVPVGIPVWLLRNVEILFNAATEEFACSNILILFCV